MNPHGFENTGAIDKTPAFLGVALDPRSEVKMAQDFPAEEFAPAAAAPVEWKEKPKSEWKRYAKRDQDGSSMCMAQSGVKMLGVENVVEEGEFVVLSALPVYQGRKNKTEGMWQQDLLDLLSKPYACLESQVPSQKLTEAQANSPRITLTRDMSASAEYYRANGYFFLKIDMDTIARIIDQGKAVQIIVFFLDEEYWKPVPTINDPSLGMLEQRTRRHGITIIDRTLYNGEKAWIIEDSAGGTTGIDAGDQRIITEKWFKLRCYGAGYLVYRKNTPEDLPTKPRAKFDSSKPLVFGMTANAQVSIMQQILQYEGYLATSIDNKPLPLGNMLQMTCAALKKWQVAHGIMDFANEADVRKVRFGSKSIALANTLYV